MASKKPAIPLTTPRSGVNVRYCRPEDVEAVKRLFSVCILQGAGSPARVSLAVRMKTYHMLFAYFAFTLFAFASYILSGRAAIICLCCMLTVLVYISGTAYSSLIFYIFFVSGSLEDDLKDPIAHYGLVPQKSNEANSDYVPSGVNAFWVAESVSSTTGKTEIVGAIGLDLSSRHKVARTGEVRRMVVSPYHRRLGIAAALMKVCEDRAKACNLSTVVLTTSQYQPGAINMYERAGFKIYNTRAFPSGWSTINLFDYGKDLAPSSKVQ